MKTWNFTSGWPRRSFLGKLLMPLLMFSPSLLPAENKQAVEALSLDLLEFFIEFDLEQESTDDTVSEESEWVDPFVLHELLSEDQKSVEGELTSEGGQYE